MLASEIDRARFYREAKASAKLNHANIVSVYQINEAIPSNSPIGAGPSPSIAMEFIEGKTLEDRFLSGPLKLDDAIQVTAQVVEGYYKADRLLRRSRVSTTPVFSSRTPETIVDIGGYFEYDLHPDGMRILVHSPETDQDERPPILNIVLNWVVELTGLIEGSGK